MNASSLAAILVMPLALCAAFPDGARDVAKKRVPKGTSLKKIAVEYLETDADGRRVLRERIDREYAPIPAWQEDLLRKELLKLAARTGPRLDTSSGLHYFHDEEEKRGKYIVKGKPGKTLFIGLHGGGEGSGDAGAMAAAMGGGGWWWIFPEVLEKTERGWTDRGTDEFVLELVEAAKRSAKVDPNRVYVTGHSMGGYGSWTLGAHHADVFAGAAAYAGGPTVVYDGPDHGERFERILDVEYGVLPNYYNSNLLVFQSLDDRNVPPGPNRFAARALESWKQRHPDGFNFRYIEVDENGHRRPPEGYLPTQQWLASHERVARPKKLLWQPVLEWKRQFHWVWWQDPEQNALLQFEVGDDNSIDVTTLEARGDLQGMSLLLGEPLIDLDQEVTVRVDGEEVFRGVVDRTLSTLLMTLPRNDPELLFSARVDLP